MKRTFRCLVIVFLLSLILGSVSAFAAIVVVTPSNNQGWFPRGSNENATGGIVSVPDNHGGSGSYEFNLTTQQGSGSIFQIAKVAVINVDDIQELSWDFKSDANNGAYPVVKIEYWNSQRSGTLVYIYNGNVTPGAWQHVEVDFQNDLWWSTEFGSSDQRTLAQWQQELQGVPVNYLEAGIGTTSGNTSASTSYIDYIHIKADRRDIDTTWDFEPDSPTSNVPTLSEWGFIVMSFLLAASAIIWIRRTKINMV